MNRSRRAAASLLCSRSVSLGQRSHGWLVLRTIAQWRLASVAIKQRLEQRLVEAQMVRISEPGQPHRHVLMTCRGLGPVRPAEVVPAGKRETEVRVRLDPLHRVVHTMHVWGDDSEPQDTINPRGETEIGVVEQ